MNILPPKVPDDELAEFLDGVIGAVEANSYERMTLWVDYHQNHGRTWDQNNSGFIHTVGHIGGRPVCVSLTTAVVQGHKILFYEPTSQVVDHQMVEDWLDEVLPDDAKGNKTNALNFANILPHQPA